MPQYQMTLHQALTAIKEMMDKNQLDQACQVCHQVIAHFPAQSEPLQLLGLIARKKNEFENALKWIQQAIDITPDKAEYYSNLGVIFQDLGKIDDAIQCYEKAICLKPDYAIAFHNFGLVLQEKKQYQRAHAAYRTALALKSDYVEGYYNLGCLFNDQCKFQEAKQAYEKALALQPDYLKAHRNLSLILLTLGDYEGGWKEYEWRLQTTELKALEKAVKKPRWQGDDLNGKKLLVRCEQGLGDTIQFSRFLPLLKQFNGFIIFECPPELLPLYRYSGMVDGIVERPKTGVPEIDFDCYVPLLSLPYLFNITLDKIPYRNMIFSVDDIEQQQWQKMIITKKLKVGLVWAGNPDHPKDADRSCQFNDLLPLMRLDQLQCYSLQKGTGVDQLVNQMEDQSLNVVNLDANITDFIHTAAVLTQLDLLISVDTSVVHLAGALGKPVWLLLSYVPDWRWMLERSDSPWYASVTIFRQQESGHWDAVISDVVQKLKADYPLK